MSPDSPRARRLVTRPIHSAALAPVERLVDAPAYAKLLALVGGLLTGIQSDIVVIPVLALFLAGCWDTVIGRAASKKQGQRIDPDFARAGFLQKVSGLVQIGIVWMIEHWAQKEAITGLEWTNGAIAAALALTLLIMELESIEEHRVTLGARPTPLFSKILSVFRALENRLVGPVESTVRPSLAPIEEPDPHDPRH